MSENRQPGKLAVILHADVAGSTRLVQQDEHLAHERIQAIFRRFSDTIGQYHGQVRELRGDALLAEFERASDAVTAALAFQSDHSEYIAQLTDTILPRVRVGIAMGEVVVADDTITGAGVVLAQRVEQLAESGGICITAAIHESLPQRLPFAQESLGEQEVKGFTESVRVYSVRLKDGSELPAPTEVSKPRMAPITRWVTVAASVFVICGGVLLAWYQPWKPDFEPASVEEMTFPLPDKPSIAVLPFTNMSDDTKQEYFVDGMTEDLITDLSKLKGLFVIARNSTFSYKGKIVKVKQVAKELGVRYVLEGSVRRAGNEVRINAQLIDASSEGHLWAERYDGSLQDIFALQDKVTKKIVAALAVNLTGEEEIERKIVETIYPNAYDAFLKGWAFYLQQTPESFSVARGYFEQAIELDPDYSRAYAALSALYWDAHIREWSPALKMDRPSVKKRAFEYREKAMISPTPLALMVAADMLMWLGKYDEALNQAKNAVKLAPGDAHVQLKLAEILTFAGQPQKGLKFVSDSARLDPHGKPRQLYVRGLAEFGLEQFDNAAASLQKALELNPGFAKPTAILAAVKGYLGDQNAASILEPYSNEYWGTAILNTVVAFPYKQQIDKKRLEEGLRKAGLKEFDI